MHPLSRIGPYALAALGAVGLAAVLQAPAAAQPATNDTANAADQQFVTQAIDGGNQEILQARAELNSTSNPNVKLFAQTMIRDHTAANAQIAAVATQLGLNVPEAPATGSLPAAMSATAYMRSEVAEHQKTIGLFKGEQASGSGQLATVAGEITPILSNHLAMAQQFLSSGTVTPEVTPTPAANPGRP